MKLSNQALDIAGRLDSGELQFVPYPFCVNLKMELAKNGENFDEYDAQHRVFALCLYAAILEDEGK